MSYVDHISIDGIQYDIRDAEAVSFEQEQTLTDAQQEQARANIGAGSETDVADLKSAFTNIVGIEYENATWIPGGGYTDTGAVYTSDTYSRTLFAVEAYAGKTLSGFTRASGNVGFAFFDYDMRFIEDAGYRNPKSGTYNFSYSFTVPENAWYLGASCRTDNLSQFTLNSPSLNIGQTSFNTAKKVIEAVTNLPDGYYVGKNISPSAVSDLCIINNLLYIFHYVGHNESSTVERFTILSDGTLGDELTGIPSNIGHTNVADYCAQNDTLISLKYPTTAEETSIDLLLFPHASQLNEFDTEAASCIKINLNNINGLHLEGINALWGDSNCRNYNIIYFLSRDTSAQKRYITRVLLGKGTTQLSEGTLITGKSADEFNGTFEILKTFERSYSTVGSIVEGTNGACWYKGAIYECITDSEHITGIPFIRHTFTNFDTSVETERVDIPVIEADGSANQTEHEGIAIHNDVMYVGGIDGKIYVIYDYA